MTASSDPPTVTISAETFADLFAGGSANVSAERAREALSAEDALRVPENYPHSVAAIVAHVQFWQAWILDRLEGVEVSFPEHDAESWPEIGEKDWEALRADFFRNLARLQALAHDPDTLNRVAPNGRKTADNLLGFASHTIYHLGQIVTVRRTLGLWPPPSGGDTW